MMTSRSLYSLAPLLGLGLTLTLGACSKDTSDGDSASDTTTTTTDSGDGEIGPDCEAELGARTRRDEGCPVDRQALSRDETEHVEGTRGQPHGSVGVDRDVDLLDARTGGE